MGPFRWLLAAYGPSEIMTMIRCLTAEGPDFCRFPYVLTKKTCFNIRKYLSTLKQDLGGEFLEFAPQATLLFMWCLPMELVCKMRSFPCIVAKRD